jgi:Flp pilus assembly protein CpaB
VLVDQPEPEPAGTVATLSLTPLEAQRLLYAESTGTIRLAVRPAGDAALVTVDSDAVISDLVRQPVNERTSLSHIVPAGHRAIALSVDKVTGAGGLIRPGDFVDVVTVQEVDTIGDPGAILQFVRSWTLAQAIEVLAVEQALAQQGPDGASLEQPGAQPDAVVVTLAVTPIQAQSLLLAESTGTIRLIVRPPGDLAVERLPDITFFTVGNTTNVAQLFTTVQTSAGE